MLANRVEGTYKPFDQSKLPRDNYERIYATHSPVEENLGYVKFDIRSPAQSHMSTVAYLERTLEFQLECDPPGAAHHIPVGPLFEIGGRKVFDTLTNKLNVRINSPGFALQNVMQRFTTSFSETTVTDEPVKWLPHYTHFFPKTLEPLVSNSGRAFLSDRNMTTAGHDQLNTNNMRRTMCLKCFDPGT